jgi:ubiquinone biosynthesis monooxygenase Coq7
MQNNIADNLIKQFDQALKTLVPGSVTASRPNPAAPKNENEMNNAEQKHSAGLMRINHTGEVCAQALYQGQALTARLPEVKTQMQQAADEEIDHLSWCEDRLNELNSHPSLLNPLWYAMSYGIGAAAGLLGDKWSLGFVAETENQVCDHINEHLEKLPEQDEKSKAILERMLIDEGQHATMAEAAGAANLPEPVRQSMTLMSQVMKKTVYRI